MRSLGKTRSCLRCGVALRAAGPLPARTRECGSGLGVLDARAAAVLAKRADLVPFEVEHFGEPRAGQRQEADRRDRPGPVLPVPVQRGAEALQFRVIEVSSDRAARVPDDVGAGVGNVLAKIVPLPCGAEHGAQYLEGAVGATGLVGARRVEPSRDPRMIDGIEPEPSEGGHQPVAHVDVMGFERGRLPPVLAALTVPARAVPGGPPEYLLEGRAGATSEMRPQALEFD